MPGRLRIVLLPLLVLALVLLLARLQLLQPIV
jgi:hypothetical protein